MSDQGDQISPKAQRLLQALQARRRKADQAGQDDPRPVPAIVLARFLSVRVGSSRDSRRRGVRLLVKELKDAGHPVTEGPTGYILATTPAELAACRDYRRLNGLRRLADAGKLTRTPAAATIQGQALLFADDSLNLAPHSARTCAQRAPDSARRPV